MSRARKVDEVPPPGQERMVVEPDDGKDEVTELSRLLEHMAFTAATLISSHGDDPARVERTLAAFSTAVCNNTRLITQQRQDHTLRPSTKGKRHYTTIHVYLGTKGSDKMYENPSHEGLDSYNWNSIRKTTNNNNHQFGSDRHATQQQQHRVIIIMNGNCINSLY
jgi:hypothetical protein